MHDAVNTKGGTIGFVVAYEGGRTVSESGVTWDEVSRADKIVELRLVDFRSGFVLLTLRGYTRYFFANEGVSAQALSGQRIYTARDRVALSAKILGGVNGGQAVEIRVDMLAPLPRGVRRDLRADQLPYSPRVFRPGAG